MTTPKNEQTAAGSAADLELMRYHDGDLDALAQQDVERLLARDDAARDKLATMALLGGLLRDEVDADTRGDGVVDAVMAGLDEVDAVRDAEHDEEQQESGQEDSGQEDSGQEDSGQEDSAQEDSAQEDSGEQQSAEVVLLSERKKPALPAGSSDSPANDNARSIFVVATAAAAVAIGLFFWGSTDASREVADGARSGPTSLPPEPAASVALGPKATADTLADDAREEPEVGVQIASVDFGSRSGAVFYVSSGPSTGATAVVWVTDLGDDQ